MREQQEQQWRMAQAPVEDDENDGEWNDAPPRRPGPRSLTLAELDQVDTATLLRGYDAGRRNAPDFTERDRGYWHGYLNGLVDGGHAQATPEQMALAREYIQRGASAPKHP